MRAKTADLWAEQDRHRGDRHRLFAAVAEMVDAARVLYPGSWCDVAASFVWPSVTYVDTDRRAARFFDDDEGVRQIVASVTGPVDRDLRFINADYTEALSLDSDSFDLLISLFAGPVSRHCTSYLRVGGALLVNASHGDAALASIDPRYELAAAVVSKAAAYQVEVSDLHEHLVPKDSVDLTTELIERTGRGVAYAKPAFAYLFRRVR